MLANSRSARAKAARGRAQERHKRAIRRARQAAELVKTTRCMPDMNIPMDYPQETDHVPELLEEATKKWKSVFKWTFDIDMPSIERIWQCKPFEYAQEQINTLLKVQIKVLGHMERPFVTDSYEEPDSIIWGVIVFDDDERRRWYATHIAYQGGDLTIQPLPGVTPSADHTVMSDDMAIVPKFPANIPDDKVVAREMARSFVDPCDPKLRYVHPETKEPVHWIDWYVADRRIHRFAREWVPPLVQTVDGVALEWKGVGHPALQTRDIIKLLIKHAPVSRSMPQCDWRDTSWS